MPRKPSDPNASASTPKPEPRSSQLVSVTPADQKAALALAGGLKRMQPAQYQARAALMLELRENPGMSASSLSAHQLATICNEPGVVSWIQQDPDFKTWLTSGRGDETRVNAIFSQIADEVQARFLMFSDKDLINAWKLVAEIADKMPKRQGETVILDSKVASMDDAAKIETLVDALKRLGYAVTPPASSGTIDVANEYVDDNRDP